MFLDSILWWSRATVSGLYGHDRIYVMRSLACDVSHSITLWISTVQFLLWHLQLLIKEKSPHWFCQMFVKQTTQFQTFVQACSVAFALILHTSIYCALMQLCKRILSVVCQFFRLLHTVQSSLYRSVSVIQHYAARCFSSAQFPSWHLVSLFKTHICFACSSLFFFHRAS